MHLNLQFTQNIEIGAVRIDGQDSLEIVTTDGGQEVRNLRAEDEARRWEISLPTCDIDSDRSDFDSVRMMWRNTGKGLHSFLFHCFVDDDDARVRFDSPLQITGPAGHLRHIDTFTIKEVLETSPEPLTAPVIAGSVTVGGALSVSNGTWSGTLACSYQWLRSGAYIAGATAATYTLVADDMGAMIGCAVTATDANGGATMNWANEVGPVS